MEVFRMKKQKINFNEKEKEAIQAAKENSWFCISFYEIEHFSALFNEISQNYKYYVTAKDRFLSGWRTSSKQDSKTNSFLQRSHGG